MHDYETFVKRNQSNLIFLFSFSFSMLWNVFRYCPFIVSTLLHISLTEGEKKESIHKFYFPLFAYSFCFSWFLLLCCKHIYHIHVERLQNMTQREYKIRFHWSCIWCTAAKLQRFFFCFCRLMAENEKHNISISFPNENYAWITTRMWIVKEKCIRFSFFVFPLWLWSGTLWCCVEFFWHSWYTTSIFCSIFFEQPFW